MELKLQIEFNQLLNIIKQLSPAKKHKLKVELNQDTHNIKEKGSSSLQNLLLHGPIMKDSEYKAYKEIRKKFNQWRAI